MTTRTASCRCGQLRATVTGDPVRVSICHCLNCKKRSGSAFAFQARWPKAQVAIDGDSRTFVKAGDSGNPATFHFCPECGTDVYYEIEGKFDNLIAIPVGTFDEPFSAALHYSVYERRKPDWLQIVGQDIEHFD